MFAELRCACLSTVRWLRDFDLDLLVCVGAGEETNGWDRDAGGNLEQYGVAASFGGAGSGLPLSLTVASYLLESAAATADAFQSIAWDAEPDDCRSAGEDLAALAPRVGMLVMGDGSARRTPQSPGPYDERGANFDAENVRALTQPDPVALLAMNQSLADELWVAGRPAWQLLAGALTASPGRWTGRAIYDADPLGVGYAVIQLDRE